MNYLLVRLKTRENALNDDVSAICPNFLEPMQHFPQNGNRSLCACETADSSSIANRDVSVTDTSFAVRLKLWKSDIKRHAALLLETLKSACLRSTLLQIKMMHHIFSWILIFISLLDYLNHSKFSNALA